MTTPADDLPLIQRYQAGDRQAGAALLARHAGLVYTYARPCFVRGVEPDDVLQEARLALLHAVERFDPDHGASLATYAAYWIRQRTAYYVAVHAHGISIPFKKQAELRRLRRAGDAAHAAALDASPELRAAHLARRSLSLDAPVHVRGDGDDSLFEALAAETPTPEEALVSAEAGRLSVEVEQAWSRLDAREQEVMRRRLLADEPETLEAIGASLGLTRERIRQIEARALQRLRTRLTGEGAAAMRRPGRAA